MTIDFPSAFRALTNGKSPFRWQERLFGEFARGDIPDACDIPTGLGKTSVMAIWLAALDLGARDIRLPRRLVYVVDRRAVVDQATEEAEQLAAALGNGDTSCSTIGILRKRLLLESGRGLPISTLRGQHVDNRAWLEDPSLPAIIVGTVDMIGSRLLFQGYGVSQRMHPVHAAFFGSDALIVLDEAHLVPPFEKLLETIESGSDAFGPRAEGDQKITPRFKLLSMSATGRARHGKAFRLRDADLDDGIVKKRLNAKKAVTLIKVGHWKLEEALAEHAWLLADKGASNIRCLVYCDSRETAERTKAEIEKRAKSDEKEGSGGFQAEVELFVGARRVREREGAARRLEQLGFVAGKKAEIVRPVFLIATSSGEVGVDLDADHMVCDLVPWERMVQRLGRVNRRGEGDAQIIVIDEGKPKPKKPSEPTPKEKLDMIAYRTLEVIGELTKNEGWSNVSPGALRTLRLRADSDRELLAKIDAATTPEPLRPTLTRALVDAWSLTSLDEYPGRPEIAPWLRGWIEDDKPQTSVVWRTLLPVRIRGGDASPKEVEDFFEAAPPHLSEELETETYRVVDWLVARASAMSKRSGQEHEPEHEVIPAKPGEAVSDRVADISSRLPGKDDVVALALSPARKWRRKYRVRDLSGDKGIKDQLNRELAHSILIVDVRMGGLVDGLLDHKANFTPATIDDGGEWMEPPWKERAIVGPLIRFRVRADDGINKAALKGAGWRDIFRFATERSEEGETLRWLIIENWRGNSTSEEARSVSRPQLLSAHQTWAVAQIRGVSARLGLPEHFVRVLSIAARLHDEGKRAARWQRAFNAPSGGEAHAKTEGPINQSLLDGYRHEFGSLPFIEKDAEFATLNPALQDLALHLVAAHHGRARPIIETRGCEDAPPSALEGRASDVALRFARLQKQWGPWGLAWWEVLLRSADHQASRENDIRDEADATADETSKGK